MYYSYDDAISDFENQVEEEIETEVYDSQYGKLLLNNAPKSNFWEDEKILDKTIKITYDKINNIIAQGDACDDWRATEQMVKENWEENNNGQRDDYPDWDEYVDSADYQRECEFVNEIYWNDFNEEFTDDLEKINYRDWDDLKHKLRDILESIEEFKSLIQDIKETCSKDKIKECFD